ncbi:MAG: phosphoglucomutase (alpha-D-glucose-1,6-bisphosphate-dependent) [Bryobacteraceae bacterium]
MTVNPKAGTSPDASMLIDIPKLRSAYYNDRPDPAVAAERVSFGTSGHRGSSLHRTFNEHHILAITQAICLYRREQGIDGPLFIGIDTHALSYPAFETALEVLAANEAHVRISKDHEFTPTPAVSHAILCHNKGRTTALADGIVVTPSHNPPEDGGFKYNPPHGGPASSSVTSWIETKANEFLSANLNGVKRVAFDTARKSALVVEHDYLREYVDDLDNIIDMDAIRGSGLILGVDPLGGAGVHYWAPIAERYRLNLKIVNETVDPTFRFMSVDWDGRIRMDPSSSYAMRKLIQLKDSFDVAFACDPDYDRHGIVLKGDGLMPPNHYLSVCVHYLFANRPQWRADSAVGKTVVSSSMIDRVTGQLGRRLHEVPVGFKFFVDGLLDGSVGFAGEESAGASFLRRDGTVWSTDKDGIIAALLSAEITARSGRDPGEIYRSLTETLGDPQYERIEARATAKQKAILSNLSEKDLPPGDLAGQPIERILTTAPGDGNKIGGLKVATADGWFAARPSGTEEIYKIYAESFLGTDHLHQIEAEAQTLVSGVFAARGA